MARAPARAHEVGGDHRLAVPRRERVEHAEHEREAERRERTEEREVAAVLDQRDEAAVALGRARRHGRRGRVARRDGLHREAARAERRDRRLGADVGRRVQQVGRVVRERPRAIADRRIRRAHRDPVVAGDQQLAPADAVGRVAVGELRSVCGEPPSVSPTARKRASSRVVESPPCPCGNATRAVLEREPHGLAVGQQPQVRRDDRDQPVVLLRRLRGARCARRRWHRRSPRRWNVGISAMSST